MDADSPRFRDFMARSQQVEQQVALVDVVLVATQGANHARGLLRWDALKPFRGSHRCSFLQGWAVSGGVTGTGGPTWPAFRRARPSALNGPAQTAYEFDARRNLGCLVDHPEPRGQLAPGSQNAA